MEDYKKIRNDYLPEKVGRETRCIFILESPPAPKKNNEIEFFYKANSPAIHSVMMELIGYENRKPSKDGLLEFQKKGFILADAVYDFFLNERKDNKPVYTKAQKKQIIVNNIPSIKEDLQLLTKGKKIPIILVGKGTVCPALCNMIPTAFNVVNRNKEDWVSLPFKGNRNRFLNESRKLLEWKHINPCIDTPLSK